jgi:hypothetical protein
LLLARNIRVVLRANRLFGPSISIVRPIAHVRWCSGIKAGAEAGDEKLRGLELSSAHRQENIGDNHEKTIIQIGKTSSEPS